MAHVSRTQLYTLGNLSIQNDWSVHSVLCWMATSSILSGVHVKRLRWIWYRIKNIFWDLYVLGPVGYYKANKRFKAALKEHLDSMAETKRSI